MPVHRVNAVLIDSRDAAGLVGFYRDLLGMPLREEHHGSALHWGCSLDGLHFAIHQSAVATSRSSIAISFAVTDVDVHIAALRHAHVPVALEPVDRSFGRLAAVRDPDGNLVYLHGSKG